jgi:hypothetical protein
MTRHTAVDPVFPGHAVFRRADAPDGKQYEQGSVPDRYFRGYRNNSTNDRSSQRAGDECCRTSMRSTKATMLRLPLRFRSR